MLKSYGKNQVKDMEKSAVKGTTPKSFMNAPIGKVASKGGTNTIQKIKTGKIPK